MPRCDYSVLNEVLFYLVYLCVSPVFVAVQELGCEKWRLSQSLCSGPGNLE